jgi:hypothetical protein
MENTDRKTATEQKSTDMSWIKQEISPDSKNMNLAGVHLSLS